MPSREKQLNLHNTEAIKNGEALYMLLQHYLQTILVTATLCITFLLTAREFLVYIFQGFLCMTTLIYFSSMVSYYMCYFITYLFVIFSDMININLC